MNEKDRRELVAILEQSGLRVPVSLRAAIPLDRDPHEAEEDARLAAALEAVRGPAKPKAAPINPDDWAHQVKSGQQRAEQEAAHRAHEAAETARVTAALHAQDDPRAAARVDAVARKIAASLPPLSSLSPLDRDAEARRAADDLVSGVPASRIEPTRLAAARALLAKRGITAY